MCGLAGMIGPDIDKAHREMFLNLLGVTYFRGRHSTGVFTAQPFSKKDVLKIKKLTVSSPIFIDIDLNEKHGGLLNDSWTDIVMAHCRSATVGNITKENAHPFDTPNLVGAHNGTLNDFWSYGKDEERTDSEIMFHRMSERGVEEVLKDMTPTSAWAVSIYMKKERKLILARNKHRPLYVAFDKKAGVMFWSSEIEMLEFAAKRTEIEVDIYHLEKNKMYVIDPHKIRRGNICPWKIVEVPEKKYAMWKAQDHTSSTAMSSVSTDIDWGPWGDVGAVIPTENDLSNEQCCICDRQLTIKDVNNLTPVDVDGIKYFCCESCAQDTKEKLRTEVEKEKTKSRLVDAYGHPVVAH